MDAPRPPGAPALAGGWCWFTEVEVLSRGGAARLVPVTALAPERLAPLVAPRAPLAGLSMTAAPRLMGIVNVTPDSFSDGGAFLDFAAATAHGAALRAAGADLLDIGGESTRPGADEVPAGEEIARTRPVVAALTASGHGPVSIDTRKAAVAAAAIADGARMVNDVSGLGFDPALGPLVAAQGVDLCVMHMRGAPQTMQDDPSYDDVLLDVYDALAARVAAAEAAGVPRARIAVDPGIGFGKTVAHNLALLRGLAVFHGLGCPILLGASRKSFIGAVGGGATALQRLPGSIAVALWAVAQGVQILRVHDVAETRQALRLQAALSSALG